MRLPQTSRAFFASVESRAFWRAGADFRSAVLAGNGQELKMKRPRAGYLAPSIRSRLAMPTRSVPESMVFPHNGTLEGIARPNHSGPSAQNWTDYSPAHNLEPKENQFDSSSFPNLPT